MTNIVNLGMAVVTSRYAVIGSRFNDLVKLELAVGPAFLLKSGLEKTTTAAATVVVGFVGSHLDDVFLTDDLLHHIAQVLGNCVAIAFAHDLAGVLNGKFDLPLPVPVRVHLQAALTDPFGVVLVDGSYFEVMIDIEFFQSGPD